MKIKYADFLQKNTLNKAELLAFAWGNLIEDMPAEGCGILPAPPLLMFDRVLEIHRADKNGRIIAELDVTLDAWFFQCHFRKDPVQPGCLGLDAIWQLLGFYATLCGAKGSGRALGVKEVAFFGQIRPHNKVVRYDVNVKRYLKSPSIGAIFAIGDAIVYVDNEPIYEINDAKTGIFKGIQYQDYPHMSENALGGKLR